MNEKKYIDNHARVADVISFFPDDFNKLHVIESGEQYLGDIDRDLKYNHSVIGD